jgi:hypothetical protein
MRCWPFRRSNWGGVSLAVAGAGPGCTRELSHDRALQSVGLGETRSRSRAPPLADFLFEHQIGFSQRGDAGMARSCGMSVTSRMAVPSDAAAVTAFVIPRSQ